MSESFRHHSSLFFLIFFALTWLFVTTSLGAVSGWYALMRRFPDRPESALRRFAGQSGAMHFVGLRSILNLSVCPSGLRIGITRIFGIFCRDFFVPWNQISVTREQRFLRKVARLSFGTQGSVDLTLAGEVADRIARAAGIYWPEVGPFPEETHGQAALRILTQSLLGAGAAAAFFTIMPRLVIAEKNARPPIFVAILFPVAVFAIAGLVQYLRRARD